MLRELIAQTDVVIENFRPGVMEKWQLGPEQLLEINPGLVMLRVTGFGQTGPYSTRRTFGTQAEAMIGLAHQARQEEGPGAPPPFGLYHRDACGGRGQVIDLSLLEPLLGILGPGPERIRPAGGHCGPTRKPVAEQRTTQCLLDRR
jgi:crotonobetainyl-CoA:carnitine CoA-transferase CaiB-like acyl-CoA transferase